MATEMTHLGDRTGLAIAAVLVAVLALSLGDAVIKLTDVSLPLWQMYILRSAMALPVLLILLIKRPSRTLGPVLWVSVRSALLVVMWLSYYSALPLMPLSIAAAAYYTAPIIITLLAAIISRRMPGSLVWLAIALGFAGVLLILRPDVSGFQWVHLLPVLAAFLYACAMVITSEKCVHSDPIVLATVLNVWFIAGGLVLGLQSGVEGSFIFGPWAPIDAKLVGVIAVLAGAIVVGSIGAAIAYQNGAPATVAAFDYMYLVFSLVWGVLFFGEVPGLTAVAGVAILVFAGILAIRSSGVAS